MAAPAATVPTPMLNIENEIIAGLQASDSLNRQISEIKATTRISTYTVAIRI